VSATDPTITCPNGHTSHDLEYCDVCGAKIGAAPASAGPAGTSTPAAAAPVAPEVEVCPQCQTPRESNEQFCEACGYDFSNNTMPPVRHPAVLDGNAQSSKPLPDTEWTATAEADRAFYDRVGTDALQFPTGSPTRTFAIDGDRVVIGRRSSKAAIVPGVDLRDPPEDAAVSHAHALLVRQPDGSYTLEDNDSDNGTLINDDGTPLTPHQPVAIKDGDRIYLGAWTKITFHHRSQP
jgi:hypothetical protein